MMAPVVQSVSLVVSPPHPSREQICYSFKFVTLLFLISVLSPVSGYEILRQVASVVSACKTAWTDDDHDLHCDLRRAYTRPLGTFGELRGPNAGQLISSKDAGVNKIHLC
jgi:hypothetical protein